MEFVDALTGFRIDGRRPNEVIPTRPFPTSRNPISLGAAVGLRADAEAQGRGRRCRAGRRVSKESYDALSIRVTVVLFAFEGILL